MARDQRTVSFKKESFFRKAIQKTEQEMVADADNVHKLEKNKENQNARMQRLDGSQESGLVVDTRLHEGFNKHDPDSRYKMDARPRGLCVLVVNHTFEDGCTLLGHKKDMDSLKPLFEKHHFEVMTYQNVTATQIYIKMRDVSKVDHTRYDCLVICIMSHGKKGSVLGVDGQKVKIHDITALFSAENCPSLSGKPKMFFIQACRGRNRNHGVATQEHGVQTLAVEETINYVPNKTDFLLGFATLSNYVALCDPNSGGWYIQALVEGLHKWADRHDLLAILTWVNKEVSRKEYLENGRIVRQAPEQTSSLRKKVFFVGPNQDEMEKQLMDVRAKLKDKTAECEHYKIAHDTIGCLHCLLMRQKNESTELLNCYIKKNMNTNHPDVARKYLIPRHEMEPTQQTQLKAFEFFKKDISAAIKNKTVSEVSIYQAKIQVVKRVQDIQKRMAALKDDDCPERYCLKCDVTELFYYCYRVIRLSLSKKSQSVANILDFLTYCQDLMTKEIHPMVTSEGGWSQFMKITDYDKWSLQKDRERKYTERYTERELKLEKMKEELGTMKEVKEDSEEKEKKSQESEENLLLASDKQ